MPAVTVSPQTARAPKGLMQPALGVLTSPAATFADVAARPRWLGITLLVVAISAGVTSGFMATEVGRAAFVEQSIAQAESYGRTPTEAQVAMYERMASYGMYFVAAFQLFFLIVGALVVSGLAFAVFNAFAGGDASFKQVFAIVAHSGVVIALQQLFVLPLDYAKESLSSPTSLAVFVPFLDQNTFVARLLGGIDLFLIWWVVTLAIGLAVLYKRRTGPVAATLLSVYGVLAIGVAAIKTALAG